MPFFLHLYWTFVSSDISLSTSGLIPAIIQAYHFQILNHAKIHPFTSCCKETHTFLYSSLIWLLLILFARHSWCCCSFGFLSLLLLTVLFHETPWLPFPYWFQFTFFVFKPDHICISHICLFLYFLLLLWLHFPNIVHHAKPQIISSSYIALPFFFLTPKAINFSS